MCAYLYSLVLHFWQNTSTERSGSFFLGWAIVTTLRLVATWKVENPGGVCIGGGGLYIIQYEVAAKNRYTWPLRSQKQVHSAYKKIVLYRDFGRDRMQLCLTYTTSYYLYVATLESKIGALWLYTSKTQFTGDFGRDWVLLGLRYTSYLVCSDSAVLSPVL